MGCVLTVQEVLAGEGKGGEAIRRKASVAGALHLRRSSMLNAQLEKHGTHGSFLCLGSRP